MGDRGNICVLQHSDGKAADGRIYIYGHWSGHDMPGLLRDALAAGHERWSDEQYLTRIIASHVVGDNWKETTGFGLSTYLGDNEYPILFVDCVRGVVELRPERDESKTLGSWSFADFASLPAAAVRTFWETNR